LENDSCSGTTSLNARQLGDHRKMGTLAWAEVSFNQVHFHCFNNTVVMTEDRAWMGNMKGLRMRRILAA
jgi:hypothetical protein